MMYSKVEVPSHLLSTGLDESSYRAFRAKALSMQKYSVSEDVISINFYIYLAFLSFVVNCTEWFFSKALGLS